VAERLLLRYQPRLVIPLGLFTIGLGFILMRVGGAVEQASWLTMLPGCVFAGVGLGLTNTPVTNTTTGSVPVERAGMASGIDMSARMISLALNIALMGFVLVEGVKSALRSALPDGPGAAALRSLAQRIAAGAAIPHDPNLSGAIIHKALVDGFGWVMTYGAVAVWVLAGISWAIFNAGAAIPVSDDLSSSEGRSSAT
jgi:hypothetical protein